MPGTRHTFDESAPEGESGVDEDSKPPSRARNDGDVAVVCSSVSPAMTKYDASGVIETATSDIENQRVVEKEENQAAAAVEAINSMHSAHVDEDDDSKPPSRVHALMMTSMLYHSIVLLLLLLDLNQQSGMAKKNRTKSWDY